MHYWLVKSEPESYSWEDLVKDKKTVWTGVRNYQARNNLKEMKNGDLVFYYHSNKGKDIVGIAKVVKEYYQDHTTKDERWVAVDLAPVKPLKKSISLDFLKTKAEFKEMQLVTHSRLSVQKVTEEDYKKIIDLSNE